MEIPSTGRGRRLTEGQVQLIRDMYASGNGSQVIAREVGCTPQGVRSVLRRFGDPIRSKPQRRQLTDTEKTLITSMWEAGASGAEIGRALDVKNQDVIQRLLAECGVTDWEPRRLWRQGRFVNDQGYVMRWVRNDDEFAEMRNSVGYVPEHRLLMARHLGRPLARTEQVHHVNGIRSDNRVENLQLRSTAHGAGIAFLCGDCGSGNVIHSQLDG